jgi:hypothetical protein
MKATSQFIDINVCISNRKDLDALSHRNADNPGPVMKAQFANIPATTQQIILRGMLLKELKPAQDAGIKLGGVLLISPEMVRLEIERRQGRKP